MKTTEKERRWRKKQKRGEIMRPSTFIEIERKAAREGATDPRAVAGRAYWNVERSKYKRSTRKGRRSRRS